VQLVEDEELQTPRHPDQRFAILRAGEHQLQHHVVGQQDVRRIIADLLAALFVLLPGVAGEGDGLLALAVAVPQILLQLVELAVDQGVHRVDDDRPDAFLRRGLALAQHPVDDGHDVGQRLAGARAGREDVGLPAIGCLDRLKLMAVQGERTPVAFRALPGFARLEDAGALLVEELAAQLRDGAARREERVERHPRVWPLGLGVQIGLDERGDAVVADDRPALGELSVVLDELPVQPEHVHHRTRRSRLLHHRIRFGSGQLIGRREMADRVVGLPVLYHRLALGEGKERLADRHSIGRPVLRLLVDEPLDQPGHVLGDVRTQQPKRSRLLRPVFLSQFERVLADERRSTRQQLVQHAAERVQVGGLRHRCIEELLRGHVPSGADRDSGARHPRGLGVVDDPAHAEIEDLDLPAGKQHHIRGLEVAVDDPGAVRGRQTVRDLCAESGHPGHRKLSVLTGQHAQRVTLEKLHGDERQAVALIEAARDDAREVRVLVQAPHDADLTLEPLDGLHIGSRVDDRTRPAAKDYLNRDLVISVVAVRLEIHGAVNLAHVALAERARHTEPVRDAIHSHSLTSSSRSSIRRRGASDIGWPPPAH